MFIVVFTPCFMCFLLGDANITTYSVSEYKLAIAVCSKMSQRFVHEPSVTSSQAWSISGPSPS